MRIDASDHHPVFLHQPEPGRSLPRACYHTCPSLRACEISEPSRAVQRSLAVVILVPISWEEWDEAHTVAMPLHLARVLRATRSPSSRCLALPRTSATLVFVLGGMTEPSGRNHSTLCSLVSDRP